MTEGQNINLVFAIGALVLVGSALFSRRIGLGQIIRTALSWIFIFAIVIVGFSYRGELLAVWNRVTGELTGADEQQIVGSTLRIRQSADGHYWVNAGVNGNPVRFLIDSGATTTALSVNAAEAANVEIDEGGFPIVLTTANGTVEAQRGRIDSLEVGPKNPVPADNHLFNIIYIINLACCYHGDSGDRSPSQNNAVIA